MQAALSSAAVIARPTCICKVSARRQTLRASRLVVRAQEGPVEEKPVEEKAPAAAPVAASAQADNFSILGAQQEAINGRAAMLGLLIAAATELSTNQSVWSQIAGKYVDRELVQQPIGASVMSFAFVVVALTFASFAPSVFKGEGPASRSFGPFTPKAESANGRLAMLGFSALLLVELVKGNTPLF